MAEKETGGMSTATDCAEIKQNGVGRDGEWISSTNSWPGRRKSLRENSMQKGVNLTFLRSLQVTRSPHSIGSLSFLILTRWFIRSSTGLHSFRFINSLNSNQEISFYALFMVHIYP